MRTRQRLIAAASATLIATGAVTAMGLAAATPALAHGYVGSDSSDLVSRAALKANTGLGSVRYEPQSLEAPKGFPAGGPADGKLASAGGLFGGALDEQSATRWVKNEIQPGANAIGWRFTAPHKTAQWSYYITKSGWDPNAPLDRGDFELISTVAHDGSAASTNPTHIVDIPADRTGYHVIYAVWDIADTSNAFYNVIDVNISGDPVEDVEAPSAPGAPQAGSVTEHSATLSWAASTDDIGVNGYEILRDGAVIGRTSALSYTDTGLAPATSYVYAVRALDGSGKVSPLSGTTTVTTAAAQPQPQPEPQPEPETGTGSGTETGSEPGAGSEPADTEAPSAPEHLHSMATTATSVDLMWTPSTDNVGVTGYTVLRDGTAVATTSAARYVDSGLRPATSYRYQVVANDAAGNTAVSETFTVTTKAAVGGAAWDPRGSYATGDRVIHNGLAYVAVQTYRGYGDPNWINAPSLWKLA